MILAQIKENCSNTVCRGWVKCVFYLRQTLSVTARIKFVMFSAWTWSFSLRSSVLLNNRFSVLIIRSSSACVWFRESLLQSIVIFYPLFFMWKKNGPSPPLAQRRTWNKDFENYVFRSLRFTAIQAVKKYLQFSEFFPKA